MVPRAWKNSLVKSIDPFVLNVAAEPDELWKARLFGRTEGPDVLDLTQTIVDASVRTKALDKNFI